MGIIVKTGLVIQIKQLRDENSEEEPHLSLDKKYKIVEVSHGVVFVINNQGERWSIRNDNWKLAKEEYVAPKTDIEWLDRVQANFKG